MGKADYTGIAIIAGIGIIGYGLLKSDFFKGVGEVGTGIGSAIGGTGTAIGDIAGDVSQTTGNIADFLNPLGSTGTQVSLMIDQAGEQSRELRASTQDERLQVADIRADKKVDKSSLRAEGQVDRVGDRQDFYTEAQGNFLNTASSIMKIPTYNPLSVIGNWVSSITSKIKTPSITGAAISTSNEGVPLVTYSTNNAPTSFVSSSSGSSIRTSSSNLQTSSTPTATTTGTYQGLKISIPQTNTPIKQPTFFGRLLRKMIFV